VPLPCPHSVNSLSAGGGGRTTHAGSCPLGSRGIERYHGVTEGHVVMASVSSGSVEVIKCM